MHFMRLGKTTAFQTRAFAIMIVVMAGPVTCGPASAQFFWGDRGGLGDQRSGGGAGAVGRLAAGETAIPRSAIIGDRRTAIFYLRSLASAAIV